jgi:hypothetical protein
MYREVFEKILTLPPKNLELVITSFSELSRLAVDKEYRPDYICHEYSYGKR